MKFQYCSASLLISAMNALMVNILKSINDTADRMFDGYENSPAIMNRFMQAEDELKRLKTEREALPVLPDPTTLKRPPFSHFIKTSTPEAMLEIIDSATVKFDKKELVITNIKPDWRELVELMA